MIYFDTIICFSIHYLSILCALAFLLTLPVGIKHLADAVVAFIVDAAAL